LAPIRSNALVNN